MIAWDERLAEPLQAVRHGIETADRNFATTHEGPLTFDRIEFPAAQVFLDEFARTAATEWTHTVTATLYFQYDRRTNPDFVEDVIHPTSAVIDASLDALGEVSCITNYVPNRINFFSGEPRGTLVLAVMVEFQATTLLDPAEFDP